MTLPFNNVVKDALLYYKDGTVRYECTTNNAEIHNINDARKKDGSRGFTKERTLQHIGSVPCDVWQLHCIKIGYNEMDHETRKKEVIKFLNQFKGWSPVENIRSQQANETNIIIK